MSQLFFLTIYYGFAQYLPNSYCAFRPLGMASNWIRVYCVKRIFKKCGHIRTINRKVHFASGRNIEIGDESGIGANTSIPGNTIIGNHVILSRNCFILDKNHIFERTDIPLNDQGCYPPKQTVIEDDCWIGMNTLMTPGRHISKGTIIGMGSILTKDFPPYSVVGGNPAKLIKSRK
ncbi:acyltransferase [Alistipes shahii]|uniref:Acyltransferase n=1 Tax=Alistipes shahii TaxID=328814 RepID=A0A5B3GC78_9BACT|nr:acyltransferase [Alistipes shahii]